MKIAVTYENGEYVLVVHQDDSVVTLFYQSLSVEVHLYNYGEIGHFWVEGYEYLRQLEYRIAILRDKLEYLGPEFCTPTEQKLLPGGAGSIYCTKRQSVAAVRRGDHSHGRIRRRSRR